MKQGLVRLLCNLGKVHGVDITHDNVCSSMLSCFYLHLLSTGRPISSFSIVSITHREEFSKYFCKLLVPCSLNINIYALKTLIVRFFMKFNCFYRLLVLNSWLVLYILYFSKMIYDNWKISRCKITDFTAWNDISISIDIQSQNRVWYRYWNCISIPTLSNLLSGMSFNFSGPGLTCRWLPSYFIDKYTHQYCQR